MPPVISQGISQIIYPRISLGISWIPSEFFAVISPGHFAEVSPRIPPGLYSMNSLGDFHRNLFGCFPRNSWFFLGISSGASTGITPEIHADIPAEFTPGVYTGTSLGMHHQMYVGISLIFLPKITPLYFSRTYLNICEELFLRFLQKFLLGFQQDFIQ